MHVLRKEWYNIGRTDSFTLVPLGDIHIGSSCCDEQRFKATVDRIAQDDKCFWVMMGDACDFVNVSDPRFSIKSLAPWVKISHLTDLAAAQRDRFLELTKPIASRCLGLVRGNHEAAIQRHYERDIYSEIVSGIKANGGFPADHKLALGVYGWLLLAFYRSEKKERGTMIKLNLHHGFTAGRLAGGKAINMQRWLWTHDADLVLFGHSHNTGMQIEAVEGIDEGGHPREYRRIGAYCGTFLKTNNLDTESYSEEKGYMPMPTGNIEITLRPGSKEPRDWVRITAGM